MSSRSASLLLPVCFGCASLPAFAQSTFTLPIEVVRTTNPSLIPAGTGDETRRGSATLLRINPQYTLAMPDGSSRTELTLGAVVERSSNTALSADRNLPNVGVLWENRGPVSVIGLRASLAEESTRETEFADFGRVAIDTTQRRGEVGATWTRELTSNTDLQLDAFHARVTYDSPVLRDFQETGGSVGYRWQSSANSRYSLTASTVRQRRDLNNTFVGEPRSLSRTGVSLRYETELTERLRLAANAGVARTSSFDTQTHPVGGVRLSNEGERLTYTVEWARDATSDGSARGFTRADTLAGSVSYAFSVNTSLTVGASRARSLDGDRSGGSLVYALVRSELTPYWAVTAGLEYRRARTMDSLVGSGRSVTLGLVYRYSEF